MQEWQRQKGSKGKGFGLLVCRRSASAVTSRGLHPGQFAARGRAGQVAPVAARCRSCSSRGQRTSAGVAPRAIRGAWPRGTSRACGSSLRSCSSRGQRTCAGVAPQAIRGAWPRGTSRALGSSLSLVLIERPAHVRGGVPPLSLRALGSSLRSCSSNRQRTCAPGVVCCTSSAPGLCDEKSALCGSIPQKEKRPAAVAAGLSLYRGAPGRYSISQQSSHTPS